MTRLPTRIATSGSIAEGPGSKTPLAGPTPGPQSQSLVLRFSVGPALETQAARRFRTQLSVNKRQAIADSEAGVDEAPPQGAALSGSTQSSSKLTGAPTTPSAVKYPAFAPSVARLEFHLQLEMFVQTTPPSNPLRTSSTNFGTHEPEIAYDPQTKSLGLLVPSFDLDTPTRSFTNGHK